MPLSQVTFPDGTVFSNRAPDQVEEGANEYGLDQGGHDPGLIIMIGKLLETIAPLAGGGAFSDTALAPQLGATAFETDGGWSPQIDTLVIARDLGGSGEYMAGRVTAVAAGTITLDVTAKSAGVAVLQSWLLSHPVQQQLASGVALEGATLASIGTSVEEDRGAIAADQSIALSDAPVIKAAVGAAVVWTVAAPPAGERFTGTVEITMDGAGGWAQSFQTDDAIPIAADWPNGAVPWPTLATGSRVTLVYTRRSDGLSVSASEIKEA